jgi:ADP-ribosylglycohydrolase
MPSKDLPQLRDQAERLRLSAAQQVERGCPGVAALLKKAQRALAEVQGAIERLPEDPALAAREPSGLAAIRALRPKGPRRLWTTFDAKGYRPRFEGAFLGRIAGCCLGAPVELWPIAQMAALARETGDAFPPTDYWRYVPGPEDLHYQCSPRKSYLRKHMDGAPVDDDLMYTVLGLLIVEAAGPGFSTEDVGRAWLRYLPHACTAEEVALNNLKAGIPAERAAEKDNPYQHWIGADIRSDPWGYLAPGWPERAAELAWRDATLSHRGTGVHGAMYFAAAIAAAFAVDDPMEALRIGLTEIPKECAVARAIRWALKTAPRIRDYQDARAAVDKKFPGMDPVHTINNACLTVFGLHLGGGDFTKVIGETVAMGHDNDCTAATAASLYGAAHGKRAIPKHWTRPFKNTLHSYLIGEPRFALDDLARRFEAQAERVWAG